ncbi:hypothetical protein [Cupriavidus malaysiensis]|uniref:Uncharacterized protein n=1 Tax=Cupriavidus malaysiensis TaxID=367825 RepID=A0ABM6F327_9BURK|nr:hypothetical protein [Cupriavidus malaysiensis]AOZ05827.1 hypothetical protein BKK80_08385 [Cupriavidus malaysiensis]
MTDQSVKSSTGEGAIWEDTVILAFRDLQWSYWLREEVQLRSASKQDFGTLWESGPAGAYKLDDRAESALGDMLASNKGRYFLMEFKAERSGHSDERGKSMFERVANFLTEPDDKTARFREIADKCHFGVFATDIDPTSKAKKNAKKIEKVPNSRIQLWLGAHPYLDWVYLSLKEVLDDPKSKEKIQNLVDTNSRVNGFLSDLESNVSDKWEVFGSTRWGKDTLKQAFLRQRVKSKKVELANLILERFDLLEEALKGRGNLFYHIKQRLRHTQIQAIDTLPFEKMVFGPPPDLTEGDERLPTGATAQEMREYLRLLIGISGPGQPPTPTGGWPGDDLRFNLVSVDRSSGRMEVILTVLTGKQLYEQLPDEVQGTAHKGTLAVNGKGEEREHEDEV